MPETFAPPAVPRVTPRDLRSAVDSGRRLTHDEALYALTAMPLLELGDLAQEVRFRKVPEKRVTYVIDSNPNYTNVCTVDCHFCAFTGSRRTRGPTPTRTTSKASCR